MSNPLDSQNLYFKLNFKDDDSFGIVETTEPVKFDGATYIIEQDNDRFGRDISFMNDSIDIFFYKGVYDVTDNHLMLPNGTMVHNLTMGFEQLLESFKIRGFEAQVEFIVYKGSTEFVTGELDFLNAETDGKTYLSCKVIQNTSKQIVKRREDLVVDVFSDEDIDGNYIEPLQTTNILLKAKPVVQYSKWFVPGIKAVIGQRANYISAVLESSIEDTLSYFSENLTDGSIYKYIRAKTDLTNVVMSFKNLKISSFGLNFSLVYRLGNESDYSTLPEIYLDNFSDGIENYNNSFQMPVIPNGAVLWVYFKREGPAAFGPQLVFVEGEMDIRSTSTAINSVAPAVRYINAKKQVVKSISGSDFYAPKFDEGGKYYDQFIMSGNLIKGRTDVPFSLKFKDLMNTSKEVASDYQILDDKVYEGHYLDFYPKREIAVLESHPDATTKVIFNERFGLNQIDFKYKTYEKNDTEKNTVDSVHTDTQWSLPNERVENVLKVELDQIRDPYNIEKIRKDAVKTTTATDDDDKFVLLDVVPLSPSARGGFQSSVTHYVSEGQLKMLNDNSFSWQLLGFGIGSEFKLLTTANAGTYTVAELTNNIITLNGGSPTSIGAKITKFDYPLDNVQYTNRTNEGFAEINNLIEPNDFSNLKYTPKRNLREWFPYIATAGKFNRDKYFRNTYFRNNGKLETRLNTETELTIEDEKVLISEMGEPRLTPYILETTLVVDFDNAVNLIEAMNTINEDDTIGGFIRTYSNDRIFKGFIKKLEYEPSSETLTATLEELFEGDYMEITNDNGTLLINEIGYEIDTLDDNWFKIANGYLTIYDINHIPVNNPIRYDFVKVNGLISNNSVELSEKLIIL